MESILLVDCDTLLAHQRKSVLERRFSRVHRVCDAADALCLVEQAGVVADLSLAIVGQLMPGIGRSALVAELQARLPGLPVVVIGSDRDSAEDFPHPKVQYHPRSISPEQLLSIAQRLCFQPRLNVA